VAELRLVATHPSQNDAEQWADFRDPRGKVHRAALHEPVGARGTLERINRSSVAVSIQGRQRTIPLSPATK